MPMYRFIIRDELVMENKIRIRLKSSKSLADLKEQILNIFDERRKQQPTDASESKKG